MPAVGFIGDELTAAGFRLAGVRVETPEPEAFPEAYARLRAECQLLIVTEAYARLLDADRRARDEAALDPLLLVVGDVAGEHAPPDIASEVRRHLGIREESGE